MSGKSVLNFCFYWTLRKFKLCRIIGQSYGASIEETLVWRETENCLYDSKNSKDRKENGMSQG